MVLKGWVGNMQPGQTPEIPQIDVANVPLGWLPHGIGTGDTFTVELVGRNEDEAVLRIAPTAGGLPQGPISNQTAQAMPMNQLQSYLQNQMAQRSAVNPSMPSQPIQGA